MRGCARSWAMAVAGLGLLAACERPVGPTQPPPGDPLLQIVTSPTSVTLDPYQTQQFLAYGRTQAGDSVAVVVSWSASGGTITSGGLYAADTVAGTYQVTATTQRTASAPAATATSTTSSGSSQVKNRGSLTQVILTPATASVLVGGTLQFAAYGRRKNGDSTSVSVVYAATGGTISADGLYTAGQTAGPHHVVATQSSGGTLTDTAAVTITTIPVASVTVSPTTASLQVSATRQFTAVTKDSTGNTLTGRVVTWASSNTAVATVSTSGVVSGMASGPATITATSEGQSGTTALTITAASCVISSGAWQNVAIPSQTGAFEAQFDATPTTANMNGVVGLANGPAADWTNLAAIVRFNPTGTIDVRNGADYAAATAIPYTPGTTYHFRLDVDIASHSYAAYVTPTGATEQLVGSAFAFRTEQSAVSVLNNLGVYASVGGETVCNPGVAPWTPPPPAPVVSVTVSPAAASVQVATTAQLTAILKDANGLPTSGSVTWTTSNGAVASVSASGLVTGLVVGTATVTATSGGHTGGSAVTVTLGSAATPLYTLGNGANYYVAPSGSDANPCTAAAPCYTMQRVSQLLRPGDNAHFAPGNYTWSYSGNKVSVSGTATAPISYISDTKWGAKIYGSGCDPIWNDGDYVQIINFDVTGDCSEGITTNGNYSKVIGNRVHDLPAASGGYGGIKGDCCYSNRTGIQIIGNVVDNIAMGSGSNLIHGIYTASPGSVIMNNIVTRVSAACITHYHGATHSIVSNNVVANCKYGIQIAADGAITSDDYTTVDNNIAVNNGRGIYEYPTAGPHNVYNNNIVYNSSVANFDLCCGGTQSGSITLTAAQFSALFVNYTGDMTGDYHLRSGAVAIDAGTTSCAAGVSSCVPLLDLDGVARSVGTAYDIGPFEWH